MRQSRGSLAEQLRRRSSCFCSFWNQGIYPKRRVSPFFLLKRRPRNELSEEADSSCCPILKKQMQNEIHLRLTRRKKKRKNPPKPYLVGSGCCHSHVHAFRNRVIPFSPSKSILKTKQKHLHDVVVEIQPPFTKRTKIIY